MTIVRLNAQSYPLTADERSLYATLPAKVVEVESSLATDAPFREADAVVLVAAKLRRDAIAALDRCRVIARYGTGVDNVDIDAATARGIVVTNYPDFCITDMAEHTMALLLAVSRQILSMDASTRAGQWDARVRIPVHRISGQRLGLLGFGRIAQAVAARAIPFGLSVVFHDPYFSAPSLPLGAVAVSFDELLATSDFLSLHVPLTEGTRHVISAPQFGKMKPSAILINTARGAIVDEDALVRALSEGQIAGAGLDVFEGLNMFALPSEPPAHPLFSMENVVLTPHSGGCSVESLEELMREGARQLAAFLRGEAPRNVVNPEVFRRRGD
ncbi:MAG: C-terminal binding protein [Acidobacteria bacterium]|nr:C-terminal binding protein [Acidobacteriota bacterium]